MHIQIVSYFYRHNHDSRDYLVTLITKFQKVLYNTFNTPTNTNFLWGVFKYFCESLHTVSRKYSVTLLFFEEQAEEFANHLYNAFTPHIINNSNFKSHTEEDPQTTTTTADKEYKPASCGNIQNHKYGQKTKKEAPNRPYKGHNLRNTRMVPRWG